MDYLKLAFLINAMSFMTYRSYRLTGNLHKSSNLITYRKPRSTRQMNYLVAGLLNQPATAFRFLQKSLRGGITSARFSSLGWDSWSMARQIATDILQHDYQAMVYAISVGDKVARNLEEILGDRVTIITINPCTEPSFLKPFLRYSAKILVPILGCLCMLLGWLSAIPILELFGKNYKHYSLALLVDQLWEIAYVRPQPETKRTVGVVCSAKDEFLQNAEIREYFSGCPCETIQTTHAQTINCANDYLEAIRKLSVRGVP